VIAKNAIIKPRTCATASIWTFERSAPTGCFAEEEFFDLVDVATIGDEENHVIICLNDGVVVRHDDLVTSNHAADACAFRQHDFLDFLADDARAAIVTVDDGFERFGRAAP
jgi:hypothetical protein